MRAKLHFVLSITILLSGFYGLSQQDYWVPVVSKTAQTRSGSLLPPITYQLDQAKFVKSLRSGQQTKIYFPTGSGKLGAFLVSPANVLHPNLAKAYPQIQSYKGVAADGSAQVRFSVSPKGLVVTLLDHLKGDAVYLDKEKGSTQTYQLIKNSAKTTKAPFVCGTLKANVAMQLAGAKGLVHDQLLRKFRIAVSASGEYTAYHGGTVADALAAINATLTRINAVFERDLAVTLELVANNEDVIFTDAETDPYSASSLSAQVQRTLTNEIGADNYDVGILFNKVATAADNNGNAGAIGSVCVDNRKGSAFVSFNTPEGDNFDLDYVAHELGHQFGANHTWSFDDEGTGVQVEPASGTTIMGYAGIVGRNNVAANGDDYFHHASIVQILEYMDGLGCPETTAITNTPPQLADLQDHIVPAGTAFVLTGSATDADGDALTYTWEQIDDGLVEATSFGPENAQGANFRSLPPTASPQRYFPRLSSILSGSLVQAAPQLGDTWETVATIKRDLNFALTVRDNNVAGGQLATDAVKVSVVNTAAPFSVSSQDSAIDYPAGSVQTVSWVVGGTDQFPFSVQKVDILLSTDGGATFTEMLATAVPNTGSAQVQLPGIATTTARIMVKPADQIFLAVNAADFTISQTDAILNFSELAHEVCQNNNLVIPFIYEAYGDFAENMTLSINSSAAFTAAFSQPTVTTNGTALNLTLGGINSIPVGVHTVEVQAASAAFTATTSLQIRVFEDTLAPVVLSTPQDQAIGVPLKPQFTWEANENVAAYDIEIATDLAFTAVVSTANVLFTNYQGQDLEPETTYYWRVRPKNLCGDGQFGTPYSFTTTAVNCKRFDSTDLPQQIAANVTATVRSTIFLPEDLEVADVNVNLEVAHTYLDDLIITLTSPAGTRVTLVSRTCGDLNNISAVFDDDASPIDCGAATGPAIGGAVKPLGALSSFNGESTFGEWILEVEDAAVSDGGALNAFSLEICVAGDFRPDEDDDGVFDDGDDLCLGTPKGTPVDTSGCPLYVFAPNNFRVAIQSEACRDSDDGAVAITATDTSLNYTATLSGNGPERQSQFTEEIAFTDLSAGTYTLCINGTDGVVTYREHCFDVLVTEPEPLSVLANLTADQQAVNLSLEGGDLFTVTLNGLSQQISRNSLKVALKPGLNRLKVSTGLLCQGVFEKEFFVAAPAVLYPNPVGEQLGISANFKERRVQLMVYNTTGRLVKTAWVTTQGYHTTLDVSALANGVYYMVLKDGADSQTLKMIKR